MRNRTTVIPNLVIAQRVIDKMIKAASEYIEDETGEAMIGLIVEGENTNGIPTIYILDTISPDANAPTEDTVRASYTFQQGDESHYEIFTWLIDNWVIQREQYGKSTKPEEAKWDTPLRHVGDWHKQPGYMIAPSGGDLHSALDQLHDVENQMDFLLAPIVTIGHPATTEGGSSVNYVTVPVGDGTAFRVDFWFIHRNSRMFFPITPVVYPDNQLPKLPKYPWHLTNTDRLQVEQNQLFGEGLFFNILLHAEDNKAPMDICFMMARQNLSKMYIIVTDTDYPKSKPQARIAPAMSLSEDQDLYDLFESLWEQSEIVADPPDWKWTPDTYLIDYIHAIEDMLGLRQVEVKTPPTEADGIGGGEGDSSDGDEAKSSDDAKTSTVTDVSAETDTTSTDNDDDEDSEDKHEADEPEETKEEPS